MDKPNIPYGYVCIEGNIGAGKTSFCKKLALQCNVSLILEQFNDNPFLPLFYETPERYAFTVELFFMTERYKQLQGSLQSIGMFHDFYLADYTFIKTLLFARKNLEEEEFKLFTMLYNILEKNFPTPDLLVYFHRDVDILMGNINARGREIEKSIKSEYLIQVQNSYFEYFRNILTYPVLIIDLKEMDFLNDENNYNVIIDLISKKYNPGVHRISLNV